MKDSERERIVERVAEALMASWFGPSATMSTSVWDEYGAAAEKDAAVAVDTLAQMGLL